MAELTTKARDREGVNLASAGDGEGFQQNLSEQTVGPFRGIPTERDPSTLEPVPADAAVQIAAQIAEERGLDVAPSVLNQALAFQAVTASTPLPYRSDGSVERDLADGLLNLEQGSKLTANDLLKSAHTLMYAPEIVNQYNDWLEHMATPAGVMDALHANMSEAGQLATEDVIADVESNDVVARMFNEFGSVLTQENKEFLTLVLAAVPQLQGESTGGNIGRGVLRAVTFGALGNARQNNRSQLAALLIEHMRHNPLKTHDDQIKLITFAYTMAQKELMEEDAESSVLGQIGEGITAPFREIGSLAGDAAAFAASPQDFAHRRHMSFGQNMALSTGIDPGEDNFALASGAWDFALNLTPVEPLNALVGVAGGIKLSKTVPVAANVSRARLLGRALVPFSGRNLELPFMSRGTIARLTWLTAGRTADTLVKTRGVRRAALAISKMDSPQQIISRFKNIPNDLAVAMAREPTREGIQDLMRMAMSGTDAIGSGKAGVALLDARYQTARGEYLLARNKAVASGELGVRHAANELDRIDVAVDGAWVSSSNVVAGGVPMKAVELNGDGGTKSVVSRLGVVFDSEQWEQGSEAVTNVINWLSKQDSPAAQRLSNILANMDTHHAQKAVSQLTDEELNLLSAIDDVTPLGSELGSVKFFEALEPDELEVLLRFMDASGLDAIRVGDSLLPSEKGAAKMLTGVDHADEASPQAIDLFRAEVNVLAESDMLRKSLDAPARTNWVVLDAPRIAATRTVRGATALPKARSTGAWRRRWAANFTDYAPNNISLVNKEEGAAALRGWLRILGTDAALQDKALSEFRRATNSSQRLRIIKETMQEAGAQIEHPYLREGLLSFIDRSGEVSYMYSRTGDELGAVVAEEGGSSVKPFLPMHFTKSVPMPDPQLFLASIRRFKTAKSKVPTFNRGIRKTTQNGREALVNQYKAQIAQKIGRNATRSMDDDELYALAYADILGGVGNRASGAGSVSRAMRFAWGPVRGLHNVFTTTMLAFRPFSWSGRVLLEESIRANMANMPNLWGKPATFLNKYTEARHIRRMPKQLEEMGSRIDTMLDDIFDPARIDSDVIDDILDIIPDIRDVALKAGVSIANKPAFRALAASEIGKGLVGGDTVSLNRLGQRGNLWRRALLQRRGKRIVRTGNKLEATGLKRTFNFKDDADGITLRSMASMYSEEMKAAGVRVSWNTSGMTSTMIDDYGHALGRLIHNAMDDPIVRYGLKRKLAFAKGEQSTDTAAELVRLAWWQEVKPNVVDIGHSRGWAWTSDVELAERYLADLVDETVETLFGHFWRGLDGAVNPEEMTRVLSGALDGTFSATRGTTRVRFSKGGEKYGGSVQAGKDYAQAAQIEGMAMPPRLSAFFDPRLGQVDERGYYRKLTDWSMMTFGEKATQALNRQPAWLAIQKRWFAKLRNQGWDESTAAAASMEKATELTNHVFFNTKSQVMMARRLNDVIPFFGAWWEVMSTWFYKLPSQAGLGIGYVDLFRRSNRFMQSLVKSGIVEPNPDGSGFTLNITDDPDNTTAFARTVSSAPVNVIKHVGGIASTMLGSPDFLPDLDAWAKDGYSFGIGSPLDPFDHGIMAVNQWGFGLTPGLSFAATKVYNQIPFGVDDDLFDLEEAAPLSEVVGEADFGKFMERNRRQLVQMLGQERYDEVLEDPVQAAVTLVEGKSHWVRPTTSLAKELIDQNVFPFGTHQSVLGTLMQVTPSSIGYMMKGLGIHMNDDDPDGGIIGAMFGHLGEYQVNSEIIGQLQNLEASEGLISLWQAKVTEGQRFYENATGKAFESRDFSLVRDLGSPELNEQYNALLNEAKLLSAEIVQRSTDNAAGSIFMRGLLGFFLPANPRMWFDQQRQTAAFWEARQIGEDVKVRGSANFAEIIKNSSIKDEQSFLDTMGLVSTFIDDPTGDETQAWMRAAHPGLAAFTQAKTFWGPGGAPPLVNGPEEFFQDVEAGNRLPYDPDIWMQRYARTAVATDKEVDLRVAFGFTAEEQFLGMVNEPKKWQELQERHNIRYTALDWEDEMHTDGRYAAWRARNESEKMTVLERLQTEIDEQREMMDEMEYALSFTSMTQQQQQDTAGKVKRGYGMLGDLIEEAVGEDEGAPKNPREQLYAEYWRQVRKPYYDERGELWDEINASDSDIERDVLFDRLTELDNKTWLTPVVSMSTPDGGRLQVPNETHRLWAARSPEQQVQQKLEWVGKPPEWLTAQASERLIVDHPAAAEYLPSTPGDWNVYLKYEEARGEVLDVWRQGAITGGQRDKAFKALELQLLQGLVTSGRGGEAVYRESWPVQRLAMVGKLPPGLEPLLEKVNAVFAILQAEGVGPTSELGERLAFALVSWAELEFFQTTPAAKGLVDQLGLDMFDEAVRSAVWPKLLFNATDRSSGNLEPLEGIQSDG